eukprot:COSAG02_NODE_38250_length_431_cov_0.903614_1_plen_136_part_10
MFEYTPALAGVRVPRQDLVKDETANTFRKLPRRIPTASSTPVIRVTASPPHVTILESAFIANTPRRKAENDTRTHSNNGDSAVSQTRTTAAGRISSWQRRYSLQGLDEARWGLLRGTGRLPSGEGRTARQGGERLR